jgi:hypothetical protein
MEMFLGYRHPLRGQHFKCLVNAVTEQVDSEEVLGAAPYGSQGAGLTLLISSLRVPHTRVLACGGFDFARCVVPLQFPPEIIEDTNEVAIQIGGHKLAQLPRFVLGLGNDLRARGLPLCEEFVDLRLAVEIEPEKDGA